jgi:uncharacterized protein
MRVAASSAPVGVPAQPSPSGRPAQAPAPAAPAAASANAAANGASQLRVAQFNVYNMFDDVNNPHNTEEPVIPTEEYRTRLDKIAKAIKTELGSPDVVNLNELENERVLNDLLARPELNGYKGILGDLNDGRGIRTAMLYKADRLKVSKVQNYNPEVKGLDAGWGQIDRSKLWARPPLVVDFALTGATQAGEGVQNITIIGNHFKSKVGGAPYEPRRQAQGEYLGGYVDARRAASPSTPIIVLGDLNATAEDGAYAKLMANDRLYDASVKVRKDSRYTYNYRGRHDQLDHVLVTPDLQGGVMSARIPHFNTPKGTIDKYKLEPETPRGTSDHDPLIVDFDLSKVKAAPAA